jgi:hypothetical protein
MAFSGQMKISYPEINKVPMAIKSGPETSLKRSPVAVPPPENFSGAIIPIIACIILWQTPRQGLDFFGTFFVKKKSTN